MFLSNAWKNDLYNNPQQVEFNYTLGLKGFTYKISFPLLYFSHNTHPFKNEVKEGPEILLPKVRFGFIFNIYFHKLWGIVPILSLHLQ